MGDFVHRTIETNGIDLYLTECGSEDAKPVIFVHGFPELGRSWRKQLPVLAEAGYRTIAPDMRGYGKSSTPMKVTDYDILQLTGDLIGLLDDIGAEKAAFVGHDWGAFVCWFMALLHADRVSNVTNLSVPYTPRAATPPVQFMKQMFGDTFFYIVYFQDVGPADEELSKDVRRTVLKFAWSISGEAGRMGESNLIVQKVGEGGFLDMLSDPKVPMPWFTDEDLDYFVEAFERTGYFGPLSWYRNMDRNWELTPQLEGAKITQPTLFIAGTHDPVIRMIPPDGQKDWIPDLRIEMVEGAGHWVHMEQPDKVNEPLLAFLKEVGY